MPIIDAVIAIDEAGTLADPDDTHLVLAGLVFSRDDRTLGRIIKRERRRLSQARGGAGKKRGQEIKFRGSTDPTRRRVLSQLAKGEIEIVTCVVDKRGAGIPDTPENYADLVWRVLGRCLEIHPKAAVVIDSHFNLVERRQAFDRCVEARAGRRVKIQHGDSQLDDCLVLVDFIAGAMLRECRQGDGDFAELVRGKIVACETQTWSKHKR